MRKLKNNNNKGFTLIELIVVMIIIGILVLLATPRFIKYIKMARYTNIINDVRTVETVSLPMMTRDNSFPEGTSDIPVSDFSKEIGERKIYGKDGYIVQNEGDNFIPEVGRISETYGDDLGNYYLLDKEGFVKLETRTRLKGDFYINHNGDVLYVDVKGEKVEDKDEEDDSNEPLSPEEEMRISDLYKYEELEDGSLALVGIDISKRDWEEKYLDEESNILDDRYTHYKFPGIPENRVYIGTDGEFKYQPISTIKQPESSLNDGSINKVAFTGDFKAPYIKRIEEMAFYGARFTGKFYAPEIEEVESAAFYFSKFEGTFEAKNIRNVGRNAFRNARFTGGFHAPEIEEVEGRAFQYSKFTGTLKAENLKLVSDESFKESEFEGELNIPLAESIGRSAFNKSSFQGKFKMPNIRLIGDGAFENSQFTSYIPNNPDMISAIENSDWWEK